MSKNMNISQYSRHRGVSRAAVRKARDCGRITAGPDGLIDPIQADADWRENTAPRPQCAPRTPPKQAKPRAELADADIANYNESRARREAANASLAEIELEARRGALIDADQVRNEAFRAARATRNMLQAIPARLSAQIAGETSEKKIYRLLENAIDDACRSLADSLAKNTVN